MVFQSYALYPHMSVRSNIAFGTATVFSALSIGIQPDPARVHRFDEGGHAIRA
jgi:ABC-type sulfate/molybdate transport systems ATPase subunit